MKNKLINKSKVVSTTQVIQDDFSIHVMLSEMLDREQTDESINGSLLRRK